MTITIKALAFKFAASSHSDVFRISVVFLALGHICRKRKQMTLDYAKCIGDVQKVALNHHLQTSSSTNVSYSGLWDIFGVIPSPPPSHLYHLALVSLSRKKRIWIHMKSFRGLKTESLHSLFPSHLPSSSFKHLVPSPLPPRTHVHILSASSWYHLHGLRFVPVLTAQDPRCTEYSRCHVTGA